MATRSSILVWKIPGTGEPGGLPSLGLYFFALIAEEGFLISFCYSLELCIQMFISFLFSFAFQRNSEDR